MDVSTTDHGMGVISIAYVGADGASDGSRTYTCECGSCREARIVWTTHNTNIASELSDADWYPAGGYQDNDASKPPQGAFWCCSKCGPYARKVTAIPVGILMSMERPS